MNFRKNRKGFTLIEMMVAVTIFTIVAVIVSGAFVTLTGIFKKVQSSRAVIDNINFVMDTMALQIREGRNHSFGAPCFGFDPEDDGSIEIYCSNSIEFTEYVLVNESFLPRRNLLYRLDNGSIIQCSSVYPILAIDGSCISLNSPEIVIDDFRFIGIRYQPGLPYIIAVFLEGESVSSRGQRTEFSLQTMLTERNP